MTKVCDYILQAIQAEGVNHLFMVPGSHVDPIMSAFQRCPDFVPIVAAHEEGAAFMADGYAKMSDKFGVALGIGGPGITNMMTGIVTAYSDHTPLLILTGEAKTYWEGRGAFQDTSGACYNDAAFLAPVTRKILKISHPAILEHHFKLALLKMLTHGQQGPVQVALPADVQLMPYEKTYHPLPTNIYHPRLIDLEQTEKTWKYLAGAKKIAILAGTGAMHANASEQLQKFAEKYCIPVATTLTGKGVFPEDHPLSLGVLGWYGNRYAIETILNDDLDVLIVLGSRLHQPDTMSWTSDLQPKQALILNDINESNIFPNYTPDLTVLGDSHEYLRILNLANHEATTQTLETKKFREEWMQNIRQANSKYYEIENLDSEEVPIHPARIAKELRSVMPKNTVLFAGEGAGSFIVSHYWECYQPRQYFTQVKYMSPMGWSIAAAIGAKAARPDLPIVSMIGDGSMMMHGMEIQTAARYNLAVIFVVSNNGAHGNPQLRAKRVGKFEADFLKLPFHDWVKFAEALGVTGIAVDKPKELRPAFEKALALNKPVLLDIRTDNYPTPTFAFDQATVKANMT